MADKRKETIVARIHLDKNNSVAAAAAAAVGGALDTHSRAGQVT